MRAASPDTGAVRTMPEFKSRRDVAPRTVSNFASQLSSSMGGPAGARTGAADRGSTASPTRAPDPADLIGAAASYDEEISPKRQAILDRADKLLGVPYVWGGDTPKGLD